MKKIKDKLSRISCKSLRATMKAAEGGTVEVGQLNESGKFNVYLKYSGFTYFLVMNGDIGLYSLLSHRPVTLGELRRRKPGRHEDHLIKAIARVVEVADYVLEDLFAYDDPLSAA